ncbi:MAG TPA: hypothetical protein VFZ95_14520 [Steroidobacteraceae bacterium]
MKMLLVFLLLGILVVVVIRSMRNERPASRRLPSPDLPPRYDNTDTSYMSMGAFGADNSHHGHGHGVDGAPSHDAGGSVDCGIDGGGSD